MSYRLGSDDPMVDKVLELQEEQTKTLTPAPSDSGGIGTTLMAFALLAGAGYLVWHLGKKGVRLAKMQMKES